LTRPAGPVQHDAWTKRRTNRRCSAIAATVNFIRGVSYTWFLSEFVFKIRCPAVSAFDQASKPDRVYFELIPDGYRGELLHGPVMTETGKQIICINDEDLFWQKPKGHLQ